MPGARQHLLAVVLDTGLVSIVRSYYWAGAGRGITRKVPIGPFAPIRQNRVLGCDTMRFERATTSFLLLDGVHARSVGMCAEIVNKHNACIHASRIHPHDTNP